MSRNADGFKGRAQKRAPRPLRVPHDIGGCRRCRHLNLGVHRQLYSHIFGRFFERPFRVVFCRFALTVARQHSGNELLRQVNGQYERVAVTGIRGLMAFTDRVL